MSSLPCMRSGGYRDCQDYLQVSSLEWKQLVWEVSYFLVHMTKLAAFCWNLAKRVCEFHGLSSPSFRRGHAVSAAPIWQAILQWLSHETQHWNPARWSSHEECIFHATGWQEWCHQSICQKVKNRENDFHISTSYGFSQNPLINKFADAEKIVAHQLKWWNVTQKDKVDWYW